MGVSCTIVDEVPALASRKAVSLAKDGQTSVRHTQPDKVFASEPVLEVRLDCRFQREVHMEQYLALAVNFKLVHVQTFINDVNLIIFVLPFIKNLVVGKV